MRRYINAFLKALANVLAIIIVVFVLTVPFWLITTYIQPGLLGVVLIFGWLLVLIAGAMIPVYLKD